MDLSVEELYAKLMSEDYPLLRASNALLGLYLVYSVERPKPISYPLGPFKLSTGYWEMVIITSGLTRTPPKPLRFFNSSFLYSIDYFMKDIKAYFHIQEDLNSSTLDVEVTYNLNDIPKKSTTSTILPQIQAIILFKHDFSLI